MIVRYQLSVDGGQLRDAQGRGDVAVDARPDALGKDGIDEEGHAVELHEPTRVTDPGQPRRFSNCWGPCELLEIGCDARCGRRHGIAAPAPQYAIDERPFHDRRKLVRLGAVEVDEAKAGSGHGPS